MNNPNVDVTVVSNILLADGIGRQGIGVINAIQDSLKVNALQMPPSSYKDIPKEVLKILIKPFDGFGKVTFWTYILGINENIVQTHQSITSPLKIAYSMFESDAIPELWTKILNSYYDMVVVPDINLVSIYQNSGVKIPIFVIPLGIMIENLLDKPIKTKPGTPFTFGLSAGFWKRKNHIKVLQAFEKKFGNDPKFKLKLHGRFGPYKDEIVKAVNSSKLNNVELISKLFSPLEYDQFMEEIDCYVYPSMGEGFSISPREMMALGKPCIISDNSAHRSICDTKLVASLPANNKIPAIYEVFGSKPIGCFYDCKLSDLADTMKKVYDNYDLHVESAQKNRDWSKQYLWSNLKPIYLNLFNPKNIILNDYNLVTDQLFQTNNTKLYNKMKELFS